MLRFTGQRPITPSALKDRKIGDELLQDVARYELHPCIVVLPAATRGVSVLSDLQAYRVGFNTCVGEGRFDLLRRDGNGNQFLQPSPNLSPFFIRLLGCATTALSYRCEQFS